MYHSIDKPFLIAAFFSLLASIYLWFRVDQQYGLYVGLWVPSILTLWVGTRLATLNNTKKGSSERGSMPQEMGPARA
ncbi:MAG: hypothetical protein NT000_05040 [Proteobacteria bacterium]|nr:hypothetical protein [Pseudomonadota bacterium]